MQHECDYLDGIVFLEKVKEPNGLATVENINKYNLRKEKTNNMELICKITDEDIEEKSINMEISKDESIESSYQFAIKKFGVNGYAINKNLKNR